MGYRIDPGESLPESIRRIAGEQLDRAIENLGDQRENRDKCVHEARKCMKRMRALVRLVRGEVGDEVFRLENACYRDAASRLAGMRDATVLIATLDSLIEYGGKGLKKKFATVRNWLVERRDAAYRDEGESVEAARRVIGDLRWARMRVADWPLNHGGGKGVRGGLRQVYARGRRGFERAYLQPEDEVFHEWRKWAKYLWYHAQILSPVWPPVMEALADELDELGDLLGNDHDLSVLRHAILGELTRPIRATTLQALMELIDDRQGQLREQAERLGRRIYVESPADFTERLRGYWQAWRKETKPAKIRMTESEERKMEPELIADYACKTGEGPLWHPGEKRLYWVDIPNGRLFRYEPASGQHEICYEGVAIGGFTIQEDGALLLFMDKGAIAVWRDGRLEPVIDQIEAERDSRFNDVIADPAGRVFCGTMPGRDHPARLYRLERDGSLSTVLEDVGLANGLGFTPDGKRIYFTDSVRRQIQIFDYDHASGEISNQRVFVDASDQEGVPDGMTVDAEGYVWSAHWDGGCLVRYTPEGKEERRVEFPVRKVSCATFGGAGYTDMYVTTAGGENKGKEGAGAGALFRIDLGIKGVPEFSSGIGL